MEKLRIVYLGTPDFAVEPLRRLVEKQRSTPGCGYEVVGVVTMPDKMISKRGNQLLMSPVKQYAVAEGLPVLQPESLKDEAFQQALKAWNADLQIVVAFRMLPESVWNMPRLGTFNLHASLLPRYRGAAPINWAIINGDKETGVTTFFLKHEIDTGDVIYRDVVAIEESDNAGTLHDKLMLQGGDTVVRTVDAWCELSDADGNILALKVYEVAKEHVSHDKPAGTLLTDSKSYVKVAVPGGYVSLVNVQLAGKKRMPVADLLRGFAIAGMKLV